MSLVQPDQSRTPRPLRVTLVVVVVLAAASYLAQARLPADPASSARLRQAVTVTGIVRHLRALDDIARESGGSRFTGTEGYRRSVEYVVGALEAAGLEVKREPFTFESFAERSTTELSVVGGPRFRDGSDMRAMMYSASDRVTAPLVVVPDVTTDAAEGAACRPGGLDGAGLQGSVVLLRPGGCLYRDQVQNAARAGAEAVIFALAPTDRAGPPFRPTLFASEGIDVPVVAVTDEAGRRLMEAEGSEVVIATDVTTERALADNVIAETEHGDDDVIMVGAHLDSVFDGPGINDNGSGSATILELARQIASLRTENTVRFAFWGGEELGLVGSTAYVRGLSAAERDDIVAYLNFDMIGSPNFARYVYSPDGAPAGSAEITDIFVDHFDRSTLTISELDLGGRSDHGPFIRAGIPVGGLFTGAEDRKSGAEQDLFGGDEGAPHDPCYHQACDTLDNVDRTVLDQMADAIAHVVAVLARRNDPL